MTAQQTVLVGREAIAAGTWAFHFRKPAGFDFKPGQAIDLVLARPPATDAAGTRHAFSLACAPFEEVVTIATRLRGSAFKNALAALPTGAAAALDGPFGSLTLHPGPARPAVFIAGGIGITPFISMLRHAVRNELPQRLVLVYANRRPEDAPFLSELRELERHAGQFRLLPTMTRIERGAQSWAGRIGRIDRDLVLQLKSENPMAVYYVAGSPSMVADVRRLLANAAINDEDVRSEDFYGY